MKSNKPGPKAAEATPIEEPISKAHSGTASSVQSVAVAFALVEELASASEPLGVSELARRLGHTKARMHRHLVTLRELGFVQKDAATDRYRLGWKLFRLGMSLAENFDLRRVARQHLLRLHDQVGQTVVLAMPAGSQVTIVDAVQSRDDVAITVRAGSLIPAPSSAMGRVIAAFQEGGHVSPIDAAKQSSIRKRWYELALNERIAGVGALAAPIFDETNQIAASVGIVTLATTLTEDAQHAMAARLQQAAAAISNELRSTRWASSVPELPAPTRRVRKTKSP